MVSWNFRDAHLQEVGPTKISGDHDFFNIFFQRDKNQDKLQCKFLDRFQGRQTLPSTSLRLIKFETHYNKSNPPLFFPATKHAMVPQHGPFSLHTLLEGL